MSRCVEIPIPGGASSQVRPGDLIQIQAFTPDAWCATVVRVDRHCVVVETWEKGEINIPAASMIQAPELTWATPLAVFMPAVPAPYVRLPNIQNLDVPKPPTLVDWGKLERQIELLLRGNREFEIPVGDLILVSILKPIIDAFVGDGSEESLKRIGEQWQTAVELMLHSEVIPKWVWEKIKEPLLVVADDIIRKACAGGTTYWTGSSAPKKRPKIERLNAPWSR